jgi:excisionase family DNA binding protein
MTDTLDEAARGNLPRLLSRSQAANYCNVSTSTFSNWVRSGKLPPPLPGTKRWDMKAIDFALDTISGLKPQPETSALDEWRARRGRRHEGNQ